MKTKNILLALSLLVSTSVFACKPNPWPIDKQYKKADAIYLGTVSRISMPAIEEGKERVYADTVYRVVITDTLKGFSRKIIEFPVSWCRGGQATIGFEAIVIKGAYDDWYISNSMSVIDAYKRIHRGEDLWGK